MRKTMLGAIVAAGAVLHGCHTITEELPTEPSETEVPASGVLTVPIPALSVGGTPAPSPTPGSDPTPSPEPTPEPTPEPAPEPPPPADTGDCGEPYPPPIQKVKAKVHLPGSKKWTLDSTALVAGADYCREIGFTDGRSRCPVRPEGHPEREACEALAIGRAADTGRPGPTWDRNGEYCDGSACENHPSNQHLLWAYKNGKYSACAQNGVCGSVTVDR